MMKKITVELDARHFSILKYIKTAYDLSSDEDAVRKIIELQKDDVLSIIEEEVTRG